MAEHPSWNSEYQGSPPWDIGWPQPDFVRLAEARELAGRVLDVGCGTGEQVMLAATHGAEAMGVDIAELAIQRAREKAEKRGIHATFQVADAILLIAALSYLGLGVPPPATNWGDMLSDGVAYTYAGYWWLIYPAGIAIVTTVVAFNLIGDAMRDAFEVRLQKR